MACDITIYGISGPAAALLHGISEANYGSGKVTKARFAGSGLNEICLCWHSYFYANVGWSNHKQEGNNIHGHMRSTSQISCRLVQESVALLECGYVCTLGVQLNLVPLDCSSGSI